MKILLLFGLIFSALGLGIFIGFVYYATFDKETMIGLESMESTKRIIVISLVLFGSCLMIYQGHNFLDEALDLQDKTSQQKQDSVK